ncbi:MAG: YfcE family phosphodiesterase [Dehalococcoidia bacterium]|nr:YfcE family phosphodiesterase [Dehalococcoidia bacterium]
MQGFALSLHNMKIGIISDTHVPSAARELPSQVVRAFEGVDLILHAGDIYVPSCLDWLERLAPVMAVELGAAAHFGGDPRVSEQRVVEVEGYAIGMIHDLMVPGMRQEVRPGNIAAEYPSGSSLPGALQEIFGSRVDVVVFGHTHEAMVEEYQGVLLVNPGSPTLPRMTRRLGTIAILELTAKGRRAEIIDLARSR